MYKLIALGLATTMSALHLAKGSLNLFVDDPPAWLRLRREPARRVESAGHVVLGLDILIWVIAEFTSNGTLSFICVIVLFLWTMVMGCIRSGARRRGPE